MLTLNGLSACDSVLIPVQCEYYALEGLSELISTLKTIRKKYNPYLDIEGVVFTMFSLRYNLTVQVVEQVQKYFGSKVYMHSDQAYQDSYTLICSLDLDENLSEEALDEKNAEYLETFPRRPSAALVQLIHDRCGTQKELSLRSGISEATISRMCSDDNFRYDIRQITRIVISLHMPPLLSAAFMALSGA